MSWDDDWKKYSEIADMRRALGDIRANKNMLKDAQDIFDSTRHVRELIDQQKAWKRVLDEQKQLKQWAEEASARYGSITGLSSGLDTLSLGVPPEIIASSAAGHYGMFPGAFYPGAPSYSIPSKKIVDEIADLTKIKEIKESEIVETGKLITNEKGDLKNDETKRKYEQEIKDLLNINLNLENKIKFYHIREQISERAKEKLDSDPSFADLFTPGHDSNCFVMSIDIRRSTELMLKAKSAKHFETYIRSLCEGFKRIIVSNNGIFDKFTGDGVLAYFPEFYSGSDAGYYAIRSASDCHNFFKAHYQTNRNLFHVVLKNTGLGIGIDCGEVHLALINNYTAVGRPVVYACRLSSACTDLTLVNQTAYDELTTSHNESISLSETTVKIKHEDDILAYILQNYPENYKPSSPGWASNDTAHQDAAD